MKLAKMWNIGDKLTEKKLGTKLIFGIKFKD